VQTDSGYQSGETAGGKLGCALAAIVGLPLLGAAFIYASMGQCVPGADCVDGWKIIAAAAAISGIVGVAARAAINFLLRFLRRGR
jgi:hypothetical protein